MAYSKGTLAGDFIEGVCSEMQGVIAVCVVDISSNTAADTYCVDPKFDPDVAVAHSLEVLKTEQKKIAALKMKENIRDIFISLDTQAHLLTLSKSGNALFYVVADVKRTNLSLARSVIHKYAKGI